MEDRSPIQHIEQLKAQMEAHADPKKAKNMAAYLKDKFKCYGIKSPVRNAIQKEWFAELKKSDINRWDIIYLLWDLDQREYQYIGVDYLNKTPKKEFSEDDHLHLEELITHKTWWETVDLIASNYVGKYFQIFPEKRDEVITRWRKSPNIWLKRTCLIFQLKYKDRIDFELLKELILEFKDIDEFFIQKAIGWSLRQHSKIAPKEVSAFIEEAGIEGLAKREASKYL